MLPAGLDISPSEFDELSPAPYITLMAIGFLIGGFGSLVKSRPIIATGVLLIFLATVGLPIAFGLSR